MKENKNESLEGEMTEATNSAAESQCVGYEDRWIEYSDKPEIFTEPVRAAAFTAMKTNGAGLTAETRARLHMSENFARLAAGSETVYLPKKGYNDGAAHSVQTCGNHGEGRICLATGILHFVYNDADWNGNRLPIGIFHVFNTPVSGETAQFYPSLYSANYAQTDAENRTIGMSFGKCWKLNYQQYLYALNDTEYVYCDEYGSEYVFRKKEAQEGEEVPENLFVDTLDKGYELDVKTHIVKRDGMFYVFDKQSCLLKELHDRSGNRIDIAYEQAGGGWRIVKITDGVGRNFVFTYNTDGTLSSITDPAGKPTVYSYSAGRLIKVVRPDGEKNSFTYNADGTLVKAGIPNTAETDVTGIAYTYGSGYKVSSALNFLENDRLIGIDLVYETAKRVKITSPSAQENSAEEKIDTYYSLDETGAVIGSYSRNAAGEVYVSGETQNGVSGSGGSPVMNYFSNNLIKGETVYRYRIAGTGSIQDEYSSDSVIGQSYVVGSNETTGINWVMKKLDLKPGTYTASAYVKVLEEIESTDGGICLKVEGADINYTQPGFCQSPYLRKTYGEFVRIAQTFIVPEEQSNYKEYKICAGFYNAKGVVLINALQLEKEEFPSTFNVLANGGFEDMKDGALAHWQGESTSEMQNITTLAQYVGGLQDHCLKMTSSDALHFSACQRIRLLSDTDKLERFVLSGFAKANVAELTENEKFELRAEIFYEGTPETAAADESYAVSFDAGVDDWQLKSVSFEKAAYRPISSLRIVLDFKGHTGEVYFDNIQLVVTDSENVGVEYFENAFEAEETNESESNEPKGRTDKYGNTLGAVTSDGYRALYTTSDYAWNGNDLLAQSDERLNKTLYDVDEATSHVTAEHAPCRSSVYYEYYDGSDNLKSVATQLDGKEIKTEYTYTSGDMTQIRTNNTTYAIAYTSAHNVESIGVSGQTPLVSYTYNENSGRLKKAAYPNGSVMECSYDREGRVISEVWTKGGVQEAKYEYTYDHEGNLIRSVDYGRSVLYLYTYKNNELVESRECKFTINEYGQIVRQTAASADESYRYTQTEDGFITPENIRITEGNDGLGRKDYREVRLGNKLLTEKYEYHAGKADAHQFEKMGGEPTTNLVSRIEYSDGHTLGYEYDASGNIVAVYEDGNLTERYEYDGLGRLTREDNRSADKTAFYEYDASGNILRKETYGYTLGVPTDAGEKRRYRYEGAWKDCLTYYSGYGDTMSYVGGNPNTYHGYTLVWEKGRQLKSMTKSGNSLAFAYNANGIRTKKTVNGAVHSYYLNGTNVLLETVENGSEVSVLQYIYDNNGEVCGVKYNDAVYLYEKNLQGDVIRVLDKDGKVVVKYVYDAWGKVERILNGAGEDISLDSTHIGNINPIRYRSYYYDVETELYYLQSRYYDPETGRFVNSDRIVAGNNNPFAYNLFVYCENDPISYLDNNGMFLKKLWKSVKKAVKAVVKSTVSGVKKVVSTMLHGINNIALHNGIDTAKISGLLLDMTKDSAGVYHAKFDCWQQIFGYEDLYDLMFYIGTSMASRKFPFGNKYGRGSYILWAWKGDYISLGAGAELGIYFGGPVKWYVSKDLAMNMSMTLNYKGRRIITYSQRTWWITGFNPKYLNVSASDLRATYKITFKNNEMYKKFYEANQKYWKFSGNTALYSF